MSFRFCAYFPFERLCGNFTSVNYKTCQFVISWGVFPQNFKKAVVTPLIKKASLPIEDLQNYRPVSGLCFMSKLVERVVVKQLMQHINSNNLDNPRQSAYKSGLHRNHPAAYKKTRSISHYHGASLLHWSYWICWLRLTQLTTLLFLIVLSYGLVCAVQP